MRDQAILSFPFRWLRTIQGLSSLNLGEFYTFHFWIWTITLTKPFSQLCGATFIIRVARGDLLRRTDKTRRLMGFKNLPKVELTDWREGEEGEEWECFLLPFRQSSKSGWEVDYDFSVVNMWFKIKLGYLRGQLQGDHSGCTLCLVDMKTKVAFQSMLLLLKHNFCFDGSATTWMVTM